MAEPKDQEPWDRANPRKTHKRKGSRKLTPAQKAEARGRARKAGRKYPNLVDNMAVARKTPSGNATKSAKTKAATAKAPRNKVVKKKRSVKKGVPAERARTTPATAARRSGASRSTKAAVRKRR